MIFSYFVLDVAKLLEALHEADTLMEQAGLGDNKVSWGHFD